jgi:hypothetical protein
MGIDTYQEPVLYMHRDCHVCHAEGFQAQSRVEVRLNGRAIVATLNVVTGELLALDEAGLSEAAWRLLQAKPDDSVSMHHPPLLESMSRYAPKSTVGGSTRRGWTPSSETWPQAATLTCNLPPLSPPARATAWT